MKAVLLCFFGAVASAILIGFSSLLPLGFSIPLVILFSASGIISVVFTSITFEAWLDL